jgi:type II secretory pathway component GspD/PulD (secretin)
MSIDEMFRPLGTVLFMVGMLIPTWLTVSAAIVIPSDVIYQDDPDLHMVAVEALVVEVNEERTRDLGLEWGFSTLDTATVNSSSVVDGANFTLGRSLGAVRVPVLMDETIEGLTRVGFEDRLPGLGITLVGMDVDAGVVSARLRALLDEGEAAIRTRPIAVALNNTIVSIETTDQVPVMDLNEKGVLSVRYENVGVRMEVLPVIKNLRSGEVNLEIHNVEVSSVSSYVTEQNVNRPVFNTSKTSTNVTLREAETFIIGGLKSRRISKRENRVPLLGWIPLVGLLFRSQEDVILNRDVLFFITPHILKPGENFLLPFDFNNQSFLGVETHPSGR